MKMPFIFFLIIFFSLSSDSAFAQPQAIKVDSMATAKANYVKRELKLNDVQYSQWLNLEKKYLQGIDSVQKFARTWNEPERAERLKRINSFYEVEVNAILTKKQRGTYLEKKQLQIQELDKKLKEKGTPVNKLN